MCSFRVARSPGRVASTDAGASAGSDPSPTGAFRDGRLVFAASADLDPAGMLSGRPVGEGLRALDGLRLAVRVGGAHLDATVPWCERGDDLPLPPGVDGVLGRELCLLPLAVVDPHLDRVDA